MFKMSTFKKSTVVLAGAMLALLCMTADAATTGAEFTTLYTTLLGWIQGYLGKSIAIAGFILGAGVGIARQNPVPALVGVVFALFMLYIPTIIDTLMTAVI